MTLVCTALCHWLMLSRYRTVFCTGAPFVFRELVNSTFFCTGPSLGRFLRTPASLWCVPGRRPRVNLSFPELAVIFWPDQLPSVALSGTGAPPPRGYPVVAVALVGLPAGPRVPGNFRRRARRRTFESAKVDVSRHRRQHQPVVHPRGALRLL